MWPLSSLPWSSFLNSCFCSSVPIRATGEHARPEPPSASAIPAQPHASSSLAATASRAWLFGFFGSGSSSTPVSFLRPSSSALWVRPSACADFISPHGIDSSASCFIAIGRICCFANAPSIWRMPENNGLSWNRSMVLLLVLSSRLDREDAAEPLVAVQRLEGAGIAHQLLDGIIVDEAVAAEDLDRVDRRLGHGVAGEHTRAAREIRRRGQAFVDRPGGVECAQPCRARIRHRVVAQPDQRLEVADRLAEL